jgi:hypothetical protein
MLKNASYLIVLLLQNITSFDAPVLPPEKSTLIEGKWGIGTQNIYAVKTAILCDEVPNLDSDIRYNFTLKIYKRNKCLTQIRSAISIRSKSIAFVAIQPRILLPFMHNIPPPILC